MSKTKHSILFETEFFIGDTVKHKINKDYLYVITAFEICNIDENGACSYYLIVCSDEAGAKYYFNPCELLLAEEII